MTTVVNIIFFLPERTSTLTTSDANVIPCLSFNFNSNSYIPSRNCSTRTCDAKFSWLEKSIFAPFVDDLSDQNKV